MTRIACQVIGCGRTINGAKIAPNAEWICADHWRLVDRRTKLMLTRIKRKRNRLADPCLLTALGNKVWDRAKAQAIERAMGITA